MLYLTDSPTWRSMMWMKQRILELADRVLGIELSRPHILAVVSDNLIRQTEQSLNCRLPMAYKLFVQRLDGLVLPNWDLLRPVPPECLDLQRYDIVFMNRQLQAQGWIPPQGIVFFSDGMGNQSLFDFAGRFRGFDIIVRQHDVLEHDGVEAEAHDFLDWLERQVDILVGSS